MIFPSKEVADGKCPDKKGLLFTIGGFILIAGTIVLVVKNSFFSIMFLKKPFLKTVLVM